ncbi:MAG: hypothetical protein ABUL41_02645 [Chitinophagaceae bacterium]
MQILLLLPLFISAQKVFQKPKNMQEVIGRNNIEQKQWTYRFTPQYVKNTTTRYHYISTAFPLNSMNPVLGNNYPLLNSTVPFKLPQNLYKGSTGFFCQQEYKFEKATAIPLRLRLGSPDYVDYLEQKPNAAKVYIKFMQ